MRLADPFFWASLVFLARLACAADSPLLAGALFPSVSGRTPNGKTLTLPAAASGKPATIVASFSRAGGNDARTWNEHLTKDFPNAPFQLIELESVPRLFRGTALSAIKSAMMPAMLDRTIVLYQDEKLWKARMAVSDIERAYLYLLTLEGLVRWSNTGKFSASEYAELKREMQTLQQVHP